MFVAVEGWSKDLPEDVRELVATSSFRRAQTDLAPKQGLGASPDGLRSDSPEVEPLHSLNAAALDRWDVQSHQYTSQVAVQSSLIARLFSGRAEASNCGLVQEAKRFCVSSTQTGRRIEYGTAVRLSVGVVGADLDVSLTLPNIAAKAQISNVQAKVALSVDGYTGPLGELLPAPDNLSVENLEIYTTAFKALQKEVFGRTGLDFLAPTLLGYDDNQSEVG